MDASSRQDCESIIGVECHIVAREPSGPRGDSPLSPSERDRYDNLILLCPVHHKLVDDQPTAYDVPTLKNIKRTHERWVRDTLSPGPANKRRSPLVTAHRVRAGGELMRAIGGSLSGVLHNDDVETKAEADMIGDFLQAVQDYLDLWQELEGRDRVQAQYELSQHIKRLKDMGFLVYACQRVETLRAGNKVHDWPTAYVLVLHEANPLVVEDLSSMGTPHAMDGKEKSFKDTILFRRG